MDLDNFLDKVTYAKGKPQRTNHNEKEQSGQNVKELNPYWQNGGTGLPSTNNANNNNNNTNNNKQTIKAGDGGLSWLKKSLQRCKDTAIAERRSLEEVVSERHESLEALCNQIKEAEEYLASKGESATTNNRRRDFRKGNYYARSRDFRNSDSRRGDDDDDDNQKTSDKHVDEKDMKVESKEKYEYRKKLDNQDHSSQNFNKNYQTKRELSNDVFQQWNQKKEANSNFSAKNVTTNIPQKSNTQAPPFRDDEKPMKIIPKVLSAEERNKISAKLLKAEIMGDNETVKQLKAMLDNSTTQADPVVANKKRSAPEGNTEILVMQTRKGTTVPFPQRDFPEENDGRRKRQKLETHQDGMRTKYFHDDDQQSIASLVREERLDKGNREVEDFIRMAGKVTRTLHDEETIDDEMLRNSVTHKPGKTFSIKKQQAMLEQKMISSKIEKCEFCPQNHQKHLVVSMGDDVMLCLPRQKSMVPGHCLIVPIEHVVQSTVCDEGVLEEIDKYKKSFVKMFAEQDRGVVFMETSKNLKSHPHLVIECIPVPMENINEIDICFQSSISDCGPRWGKNKKLVIVKGGVKRTLPPRFPYFHVSLGMEEGYAHVMEDEVNFPWYFGREIIGGMLDLESTLWRKPRFDTFEEQRRKVVEFTKGYKRFEPARFCD